MKQNIIGSCLLAAGFWLLTVTAATAQTVHPSVSILGDSYSTFEGWLSPDSNAVWYHATPDAKRTDVKSVGETWWYRLIRQKGWKLEVNNSFSGATVCTSGYRDEDYSNRSFVNRALHLGSPDIIIVFGGTNDSWAGSPIGEFKYADWRRADLCFFRPAMACLLARLRERYPTAAVYVLSNDGLKTEVTSSMKTICEHYGVPMIQLKDIDKKSGHPSVKGMQQIADQVAAALK